MIRKVHMMIGAIGAGPASGGWYRTETGEARYKVRSGDTLGALSLKYMGSGDRYLEIWNAQTAARRARTGPNMIIIGESLVMPSAAIETAMRLGLLAGGTTATPSTQTPSTQTPSTQTPATKDPAPTVIVDQVQTAQETKITATVGTAKSPDGSIGLALFLGVAAAAGGWWWWNSRQEEQGYA